LIFDCPECDFVIAIVMALAPIKSQKSEIKNGEM
jgi:hypothetical protein